MKTTSAAALSDLRRRVIRAALSPAERPRVTGMALRLLRVRCGLSQRQLAARVGIAQVTISRLERDARRATPEVLEKMLDAMGRK